MGHGNMKFNGNEIDEEFKQKIISEYLKSSTGRSKLAQAMIAPLKRRMWHPQPKYYCVKCDMRWNDDDYAHSDEDCATYFVTES